MTKIRLTAAAALGAVIVATPALARPMTPEDVARLQSVGAIAVSPDGEVAYNVGGAPDILAGEDNGAYDGTLMVATAPGEAKAYLPAGMSAGNLAFSPDGDWLAFTHKAEADEETAVWAVPLDGGAYRKIAAVEGTSVRSYAFGPDGSTIYMLVGPGEDSQREKESKAGFNAIVYEEENRAARLFRAKLMDDGIDEEPVAIAIPGFVNNFDIADNGRFAIVGTQPTPQVDDTYVSQRINIIDLASGDLTVVATPGKIGDVEIAPDGRTLSLIAGVDMNDPAATTLHLVDVATGDYRALNAGAPEAAVDAEYLANGDLAAVIHQGVDSLLRIYGPNGAVKREVAADGLALSGVEAEGSTIVVRASAPTHPSELFSLSRNSFTRWTSSNDWLGEIDFGAQRAYTYTARDGQQIEGVLVEPVGGAPAGGAPLILDVHGGPEAHESNGWVTNYGGPGQVAAGQGYAVFLPNYRGSTGYGTAFSKQHQGNYTDPEFTDLVDAKRALVADGIADPERTGITGGSYGGYASAWGATALSDEFAAAVMFVGISNQISKFGTTDIPYEMYNVHSRAWPWDDWQKMLEVSPIYHVDKAETPILIMHGEEDTRVSPSQSYELYRSIKVRKPDTPVRLVLYPGEGHGNRLAAAKYDYNLRMMRWFDTYLKTGDRDAPLPGPRVELPESMFE
ncbi:alpha/beta hydrolase family protein [Sphingomicrobium astaxanthinifaciens]|uniref:alpha/beta hydrolase family protein n=1 Tax=Sphingomicrobium astaxanthinifaciens TaxID=1227949 RepID=UPI001FCBB8B7|nr:S9 family peptidase [Sphingomicrobium astaxanthinifaciens]MCJ7421266.1 S9 family peptidase [Sphingomicrobium astaxanthinifaciens]